jgi:hypothetical protein
MPVILCPVGLQTYNFLQLAAQQPNFKGDSLESFTYCRLFKRWKRDFFETRHGQSVEGTSKLCGTVYCSINRIGEGRKE